MSHKHYNPLNPGSPKLSILTWRVFVLLSSWTKLFRDSAVPGGQVEVVETVLDLAGAGLAILVFLVHVVLVVLVRGLGLVDLHEAVVLVRRVERLQDVLLVKVRVFAAEIIKIFETVGDVIGLAGLTDGAWAPGRAARRRSTA